jgi:hypothetical protein
MMNGFKGFSPEEKEMGFSSGRNLQEPYYDFGRSA